MLTGVPNIKNWRFDWPFPRTIYRGEEIPNKKSSHSAQKQISNNVPPNFKGHPVRIMLLGATGEGKTATVKHLIGQNNDMEELGIKTSDTSSETRETVEYMISYKGTTGSYHMAETVSFGIVDTPGLNDTDGEQQDARNLASIKTF